MEISIIYVLIFLFLIPLEIILTIKINIKYTKKSEFLIFNNLVVLCRFSVEFTVKYRKIQENPRKSKKIQKNNFFRVFEEIFIAISRIP